MIRLRAIAVAAALFVGAAPIVPLAHDATERHAVCPEHGELIHGASGALAVSTTDVPGVRAGAEAETDEHEHCSVPSVSPHEAAPFAFDSAPFDAEAGLRRPPLEAVFAGLAIFRIAPKNSPPA